MGDANPDRGRTDMLRMLYPELFSPRLQADNGGEAGGGESDGATDEKSKDEASQSKDKPKSPLDTLSAEQQDEMNRLIDNRVKRAVDKAAKDAAKAERDRIEAEQAEKGAQEQGNWKDLADKRQSKIDELERSLQERDRRDKARDVGTQAGLTGEALALLIEFAELKPDGDVDEKAATLKKLAGAREAPDTEGGAGTKRTTGSNGSTEHKTTVKQDVPPEKPEPVYTFDGRPKVAWNDDLGSAR